MRSRLRFLRSSMRAAALNGGVLTSPRSQTSGLSEGLIHVQDMSNMTYDPTTGQPRRPSLWPKTTVPPSVT
jgi:hypothetical protein